MTSGKQSKTNGTLFAGIANLHNTCYAAAVIQAFYASERFASAMRNGTYLISEIFRTLDETPHSYVDLSSFYRRFNEPFNNPSIQHDASEFAYMLLDELDNTPLMDLIKIKIKSFMLCHNCGATRAMDEEQFPLLLPVGKTFDKCFSLALAEQNIEGGNESTCERCKKRNNTATQFRSLPVCPPVLVLQFMRYSSEIKTPPITPVIKFNSRYTYKLCAAIIHYGREMSSGHYISYCTQGDNLNWVSCDDSHVREVSWEDMYAYLDKDSSNIYMLVYELV